jgi:two-component system, chemotaxis family, protein-glutamate methylesterase/glutaminase
MGAKTILDRTIRVLLVDDSDLVRSMLRSILEEDGAFAIVGEAANGKIAIEKAKLLRPDLITMDLEMPVMDGMTAIEEIMNTKAVPILVVSSIADAEHAYQAVSLGAVDATGKPGVSEAEIAAFVDKAKQAAQVPVITRVRRQNMPGSSAPPPATLADAPLGSHAVPHGERIVAIACSTGGPQALSFLLSHLTARMKCPIVVAQHISDGFADGMAAWLASVSALPVVVGEDGAPLQAGRVYLSPSERNMSVTRSRRIALKPCLPSQIYHPSCDTLLTDAATAYGRGSIGVILTGMGSDGVRGMKAIQEAGGVTLAQDERSSLIFGMNALSIEKGWVRQVLPLPALADALTELGGGRG